MTENSHIEYWNGWMPTTGDQVRLQQDENQHEWRVTASAPLTKQARIQHNTYDRPTVTVVDWKDLEFVGNVDSTRARIAEEKLAELSGNLADQIKLTQRQERPTEHVEPQQPLGDDWGQQMWEPQLGEDEELTVDILLGQALGAASMCWTSTPTGTFWSEKANWVLDGVKHHLKHNVRKRMYRGPEKPVEALVREQDTDAQLWAHSFAVQFDMPEDLDAAITSWFASAIETAKDSVRNKPKGMMDPVKSNLFPTKSWSEAHDEAVKAHPELSIVGGIGEVRTTSHTGGEKGVKEERYDLIPVGPLAEVARLYGRGAQKYAEHNWRRGYDWSKSYQALQRHATEFWNGQDTDPEMGVSHMASVVFHALALIEFSQVHRNFDDRFKG